MCSVLFCVWDLKRWIDGWSKLKGAVDATVKGPESRSANLWIGIRTWICAMCACVWGSQIPLQRQDRERSKPGLSEESVAAIALRCVALALRSRSFFFFADAALDRQIFCSIRYVSFHILVLSVCHKRQEQKSVVMELQNWLLLKKTFKRLKKVQSHRRKTEERTRANGRARERERDRERFKCRVHFSVL